MKKHLIVSGITFVLLIVGLSGCSQVGYGIVNIGDISANPEKYYDMEVTIEGFCSNGGIGHIADDKGHGLWFQYDNSVNGMYRLTGIIREGNFSEWWETGYYLDVSQVKAL